MSPPLLTHEVDYLEGAASASNGTRPRTNSRKPMPSAAPKSSSGVKPAESMDNNSEKQGRSKISAKRAEQNRAAQRAFRERRIMYVKNLEDQLQQATERIEEADRLREQNSELRRLIEELNRENQRLKSTMGTGNAVVPQLSDQDETQDANSGTDELESYDDGGDYEGELGVEGDFKPESIDDVEIARHIYQSGYEPSLPSPTPFNLDKLKTEDGVGVADIVEQYVTQEGQIDLIKPLKRLQNDPTVPVRVSAPAPAPVPVPVPIPVLPASYTVDDEESSPIGFRALSSDMLGATSILEDDTVLNTYGTISPPASVPSMPDTAFTDTEAPVKLLSELAEEADDDGHCFKRPRDLSSFVCPFISADGQLLPLPTKIFSKSELAGPDREEQGLCELLRRSAQLAGTDVERFCTKSKVMKKATVG